ncbi:hypothetical protein BGX29_002565 [Mortierella sp. GBA35]|nr:hypothetical protein BGX23_002620 [Mortierella sp. AD031]KAF9084422.1 hypothetical protein BGX29_002565 [Mortierella sp. GBA35]KAG0197685.1 hypothetical protein BGX33_000403 [Mortierella sp. NVP41]
MGQLEASCFAQVSGNTLYALAFGYDHTVPSSTSGASAVVVLLKSNTSPSSPSALTWEVVSTIPRDSLFSFGDSPRLQCLVDPNGGFLAWSYNTYRPGQGPAAQSRPGGFRYDPSLPEGAGSKGKGGWANVETPMSYSWTSSLAGGDLFYVKEGSQYNIYHIFIPGTAGATFSFGALNTATTPNMMENSFNKWPVGSTITGYVDSIKTTATKLFIWGVAGGNGRLFAVGDLPQGGRLSSTPPSLQLGNYSTPVTCSDPVAIDDKVYKYCSISQTHGKEYKLYAWDGSKALDPIAMSQLPVKDSNSFTVTGILGGGDSSSSTTYMLVQSGRLYGQYGSSGYSTYVLKALALTGPSTGSVVDVPNNITVSDKIAFYKATDGGGDLGDTLGNVVKTAWMIRYIPGALGLLIALCCVFCCVRRYRARNQPVIVVEEEPPVDVVMVTTTHTQVITRR